MRNVGAPYCRLLRLTPGLASRSLDEAQRNPGRSGDEFPVFRDAPFGRHLLASPAAASPHNIRGMNSIATALMTKHTAATMAV